MEALEAVPKYKHKLKRRTKLKQFNEYPKGREGCTPG